MGTKQQNEYFLSGLEKYLLEQSGVTEVTVKYGNPLNHQHLSSWQHTHSLTLPDDVRQFYTTHDGASLLWRCTYNSNPIGLVNICSLSQLKVITINKDTLIKPSLIDDTSNQWTPLSQGSYIVIFTSCFSCGYTCLVYKDNFTFKGIWLIDLSFNCHYICSSFSDYLRLITVHLGLVQWPYALTPLGMSSEYQVWFQVFAPQRLSVDISHFLTSKETLPTLLTRPNFDQLKTTRKRNKDLKIESN